MFVIDDKVQYEIFFIDLDLIVIIRNKNKLLFIKYSKKNCKCSGVIIQKFLLKLLCL